jgi:hypothetical protein
MAQIYNSDSGLMAHQGQDVIDYQDWDDFGSWTVTNSAQVFPADWEQHAWFYVESIGQYFKAEGDLHALFVAAKTLFTPERWEEIRDALDEMGPIKSYLDRLDLPRLKRKAQRARDIGLITQDELTALSGLLP